MVEKGIFDSVKEGGVTGATVGFSVGAVRLFLNSSEYIKETGHVGPRAKAPLLTSSSSIVSAASLLRPSPMAQLAATTGAFAGLGAVYLGTETLLRNNRDKDDVWNRVIAGSLAGSLVGLRTGSLFVSGGAAAAIAFGTCLLHLTNDKIGPMNEEEIFKKHEAIYTE